MTETIAPVSIHVRELDQGPDENTPRYWFGNDIFVTHFFNALSSTFPEGERFFIRSVRRYADQIDNGPLAREVTAFVGQEGRHSKAHDVHVALLVNQGYGVLRNINRIQRVVMTWLNDSAPRLSLALTTAIEHVTAVTAHQILEHPDIWTDAMDPSMQRLWRWHAVEETEHKAVAFDVYQQADGSVWLRRLAMVDATFGFLAEIFMRHSLMLIKDRQFRPTVLLRGFTTLFGRDGFVRALLPHLMDFYRRDFHPWDHENRALLEKRKLEGGLAG